MNKQQIIEQLARDKVVEDVIKNVCKCKDLEMKDLAQDLYLDLLQKPEEKIQKLFNNQQIEFFITKMVQNNYFSTTSPFYTKYRKFKERSEELDDEL